VGGAEGIGWEGGSKEVPDFTVGFFGRGVWHGEYECEQGEEEDCGGVIRFVLWALEERGLLRFAKRIIVSDLGKLL